MDARRTGPDRREAQEAGMGQEPAWWSFKDWPPHKAGTVSEVVATPPAKIRRIDDQHAPEQSPIGNDATRRRLDSPQKLKLRLSSDVDKPRSARSVHTSNEELFFRCFLKIIVQ